MPIELIITNITLGFTFLVCLVLGIFVYIRRPKDNSFLIKFITVLYILAGAVTIFFLFNPDLYTNVVSLTPQLIIFSMPISLLVVTLVCLYVIPLACVIIKYEMIDINLLTKRSLVYTLGIAGIALFIMFINYANDAITATIPGFPQWLLPLISGIIGVMLGTFIWKKIQEADYLKFQFVDVVTHKFRTPLTHIKWSAEVLHSEIDPKERADAIAAIEDANVRLFEMTNSMIGLSRSDDSLYQYTYAPENIVDMLNETLAAIESQVRMKKITVRLHVADNLPSIFVDRKRVQFVMQMILENSVVYSELGGAIDIIIEQRKTFLYFSVQDKGIGISPEDMAHLFSRFFRGSNALETHTEGLGIGLYVSRDIMKRHNGDLWAESAGLGKGSVFHMKIPLDR